MATATRDEILIPQHEAARRLSISMRMLSSMTAAKKIPFVRIGRRVLFSVTALNEWIAKETRRASTTR